MVNCDTSFIFSLVFDINISQGSGYSDKQSSAWWLTTLPQFAGPCRRRVWSTSTPLCRIEPFADSAVQTVNHRQSSVSGRSSTVLEQSARQRHVSQFVVGFPAAAETHSASDSFYDFGAI